MKEIPDPTFSQGVLGVCCGIEPETGKVYSPMDGTIRQLADTLHAIGIEAGGVELLIHVGIDTVGMNGDGFRSHIKEGQTVKRRPSADNRSGKNQSSRSSCNNHGNCYEFG